MKELLRDPVIQQTRLMPSDDPENPLDQLSVAEQEKAQPLQVGVVCRWVWLVGGSS